MTHVPTTLTDAGLALSEIEQIAHAAWSICAYEPRSGLTQEQKAGAFLITETKTKAWSKKLEGKVEAAATIEHVISQALGLTKADLGAIYDADRSDRRGFWRYFDAEPEALAVVKEVLSIAR